MGDEFPNSSAALREGLVICSNRVMLQPLRNQDQAITGASSPEGSGIKISSQCLPIDQWINGWEGISEVIVCQGLTRRVSTDQALDQWIGGWKSQSRICQKLVQSHPLITYFLLFCLWLFFPSPTHAYVEAPHSLGLVCTLSTNIMVLRVEKIDRQNNLIIYRKVRDIKGQHPTDVIKHNIGRGGFHPREWQYTMEWAEVGKTAVFFHNGGASETCIGTYWYQAYANGDWWGMSHGEPYLLRSFAGNVDKLAAAVVEE